MEKFYEKAISVKPEAGLPERIEKFIEGLQGEKPTTGKALFKSLLEYAETHASTANCEEENKVLTEKLDAATAQIDELTGKLSVLEQSQTLNTEAANGLQAENETLKKEIERLKVLETTVNEIITGFQTKLPEVFKAEDTSPAQTIDRAAFLITELRNEISTLNTRADELETTLQTEKTKPAKLLPGQAIVGFTPAQLENIRMLRMILEKMGHQFKTTNAEEVIHAAIAEQIETSRMMVGLCKSYSPLLTILNP